MVTEWGIGVDGLDPSDDMDVFDSEAEARDALGDASREAVYRREVSRWRPAV